MALPLVAVVGRPNVGKSTFVNRIIGAEDAIVHEMRGVTRDRSYHEAEWNGVAFTLVDTGGIEMGSDDDFQMSISNQAFTATNEADVIVLIVDARTGINADDEEVARLLRKSSKPTSSCSSSTARRESTPTTKRWRVSCAGRTRRCFWS